jgi:hypothetical protein
MGQTKHYDGPDLATVWIAYAHGRDSGQIHRSSDVILISKTTGEVLYAGSANDEG